MKKKFKNLKSSFKIQFEIPFGILGLRTILSKLKYSNSISRNAEIAEYLQLVPIFQKWRLLSL